MDLLGMLKDQVSGPLAGQASKFLGESESSVGKALGGIFPALLGSTIGAANDEAGAGKVLDLLKGMDTGGMDNIAGIFGGGASGVSKLMNQGSGALNLLLGNKSGGMIDSIAKFAGLRGSSASSLIKMAAPFLMKMIGSQVMKNKLGASGLMDFLGSQKSSVKSAMPAGLSGLNLFADAGDKITGAAKGATEAGNKVVGGAADAGKKVVSGATNVAGNVASKTGDAVESTAKAGGGILRFLLPIVIIGAALAFFAPKFFGDAKDAVGNAADKAGEMAGDAAGAVGDVAGKAGEMAGDAAGAVGDVAGKAGDMVGDAAGAVGDAAGKMGDAIGGVFGNINEAAKGALDKITFTAGSAGNQMMEFIDGGFKGDANFTFKDLTFDTGSANISGATASEVDNVAAILKAYPDVKVAVTGYTDNTGDAAKNIQLSKARAQSVKARLVSKGGIAASRITVNGLGSDNPVGDNSTPEGRKQNRRIEMKIMK